MKPNAVPFEIRTAAAIEIPGPVSGGEDVQNEALELGEGDFGTGDHEEQSPAEIELRVLTSPTQAGPVGGIVNVAGLVVHPLILGDELGIDRDVALPVLASIKRSRSQSVLLSEAHSDVPWRLRLGDDLAVALEVPDTAPGGGPEESGVQEHVRSAHQPPHLVRVQGRLGAERHGAPLESKFGTDHDPQRLALHLSGVELTILIISIMVGQLSVLKQGIVGDLKLTHLGHPLAA